MDELTSTTGIVALAACAIALVALLTTGWLALTLHRVRHAQRVVLGGHRRTHLIDHAARLEHEFTVLHDYVEDAATGLHERMGRLEERLDGAVVYRALVRYDAYGEMSGRQSSSLALLDSSRSGIVLSSIHHRDQARFYAKEVHDGQGDVELSPEEAEAVRLALAGGADAVRG